MLGTSGLAMRSISELCSVGGANALCLQFNAIPVRGWSKPCLVEALPVMNP
jgi:hypothetical protein